MRELREAQIWCGAPLGSFGKLFYGRAHRWGASGGPGYDVADHWEASRSPRAASLTIGKLPEAHARCRGPFWAFRKPSCDAADHWEASGSPGTAREVGIREDG